MKNRNIILIVVICLVIATVGGVTMAVLTAYTPFEDENIKVEVPRDTEFQAIKNNASLEYISTNPKISISTVAIESNNTLSKEYYHQAKNNTLNKLKSKTINSTEHDYNGTIYKSVNNTNNDTTYSIVLFNDSSYSISILVSEDLNSVIHMAETFQLKKPYTIKIPTEKSQLVKSKNNDSNSTNDLLFGFLYGYYYGYYDGYYSSSDNYYDDSYYDDSYYDDYYDDSYYDDGYYDDGYYDDYYYDSYYEDDYYY